MFNTQPNTFSPLLAALSAAKADFAAWRACRRARAEARAARRAFSAQLHLDDRILADIGLTRAEVEWAAALPLETCAATTLRERINARRAARCPSPE